jgi:hypothetical protein
MFQLYFGKFSNFYWIFGVPLGGGVREALRLSFAFFAAGLPFQHRGDAADPFSTLRLG